MKENYFGNISVINARTNNLKGITVDFPIEKFTAVTGISGGGKSSLVYDTLYVESQREFFDCMSSGFFAQKDFEQPLVDDIINLKPALSLAQNLNSSNPRSTVGTITGISRYLRALYSLVFSKIEKNNVNESYFSQNNINGCCSFCSGTGIEKTIDINSVIPDPKKRLDEGAIAYYEGPKAGERHQTLLSVCNYYNIDITKRFDELTKIEKFNLLKTSDIVKLRVKFSSGGKRSSVRQEIVTGVFADLQNKLDKIKEHPGLEKIIGRFLKDVPCTHCGGTGFSERTLKLKILGCNIGELEKLSLFDLQDWCLRVAKEYTKTAFSSEINFIVAKITSLVKPFFDLKLGYLSLGRKAPTLSGGEYQRLKLGAQINCRLSGMLYILDEPCKGLHPRDIGNVTSSIERLKRKGNTVIAIEHNNLLLEKADKLIILGPEGGEKGGHIVYDGKPNKIVFPSAKFKQSTSVGFSKWIRARDISFHNIKNQSVDIPCGAVTCITGVSGSGKSSLLNFLLDAVNSSSTELCRSFEKPSELLNSIYLSQKPIGKNPRSTILSYLDISQALRDLFASTREAKKLGLSSRFFSINVDGGRCEKCLGTGLEKIDLAYLPPSYITCTECHGLRFHADVLSIKYKGLSISDILDSSAERLLSYFDKNSSFFPRLKAMCDLGIGYLHLGQTSMSLSGGEAQRIRIAKMLSCKPSPNTIYLLDEPTSGLDEKGKNSLFEALLNVKNAGGTLIIVEHDINFIAKIADYLVDFGTRYGNSGGIIAAKGSPYAVVSNPDSSWYGLSIV